MSTTATATATGPPMNPYEAQRESRIAQNQQRMRDMGIPDAAFAVRQICKKPAKPRTVVPKPVDLAPTRVSKRIRGEKPVYESKALEAVEDQPTVKKQIRKQEAEEPRFQLVDTVYAAPFTLTSCGVTVWELGEIYRGPFSKNYYSSKGCLYRHPYPVGYRATKQVFGRTWEMTISAGAAGPVFTVSQQQGSLSFSGPSPTAPWTDVCQAIRPTQRISGPLFFGFSDVHMQRALAALYTPAELAHAQYGTSLPAAGQITPPEQQQQSTVDATCSASGSAEPPQQVLPVLVAQVGSAQVLLQQQQQEQGRDQCQDRDQQQKQKELAAAERVAEQLQQQIKGVGAATAQALALTVQLGGVRHSSVRSLCSWLAAGQKNQQMLRDFLLTSEEVPRSSRQLPSWRKVWVPKILEQLLQLQAAAP